MNLNLILILAIVAVVSVPIAYALVESSIVINMLSGQTTDPFVVKDFFGTEVFTVKSTGNLDLQGNDLVGATIDGDLNTVLDISEDQMNVKVGTSGTVLTSNGVGLPPTYQAGGGGEVFTWTGDHSAGANKLTNLNTVEFGSSAQNIRDNGFGDIEFNVASTEAFLMKMGAITEYRWFGTGNGNFFDLGINKLRWGTDGHEIIPTSTSLDVDAGTASDRVRLQTFGTDRFTVNNVDAQISVPFDFNSNAITEAVIDGDLNTILDISEDQMNVKVGTSGTVLTSNGVGLAPTYQAGGGGGEVFTWTADHDASGFSLDNFGVARITFGATSTTFSNEKVVISGERLQTAKGADRVSAGALILGDDGNFFHITGTNTIQTITGGNWQAGSIVILHFDSPLQVVHNAGGVNPIFFASNTFKNMVAGDVLTLVFDNPFWLEVSCTC